MYFVNAYGRDGSVGLPANEEGLNKIVQFASRSSLDGVAWGLVYPDFLRTALPFFSELPFFWKTDRGVTLELEWQRGLELDATLNDWHRDVALGKRPATVFNATIVDSGQPLFFSTVDLKIDKNLGKSFNDLYHDYDIKIPTAVRLSSTFPYVTPAARLYYAGNQDLKKPEFHITDGGYYDNYGMTILIEWLDKVLESSSGEIKEVLFIRIHGAAVGGEVQPSSERGWFYQSLLPLNTLVNVRGAGQLSHSRVEFDLMKRYWLSKGVSIESALFEFSQSDGSNDDPPLSWHLTDKQRAAIEAAWQKNIDNHRPDSELNRVIRFIGGTENEN